MDPRYPSGSGSVASVRRHPLHPMLVPLPIGLLVGALVADLAFAFSRDPFWARAAYWLIVGGLLTGVMAAVAGVVETLGVPRAKRLAIAWVHGIGNLAVLALAAINLFIRHGDAAAAVVPVGLTLSIVATLILGFTGWLGGELSFRHGIGVSRHIGASHAPDDDEPMRR